MLNGMSMQNITLVDVTTPDGWVNDVANGSLDAISTAQPYANAARERLGDNAIMWPVQSRQPLFALAVSTNGWITEHPDTVRRFLQALAQAEDYTGTHPSEARAIVQKSLNLSDAYMQTVWQQNQFSLTLDQSLIAAMEDESRWMIQNNMTNATKVPDFQKYMYVQGLNKVKPESVGFTGMERLP